MISKTAKRDDCICHSGNGLIMIAVSFVYLISSEKQTKSANSREFISSAESVISYLGGQTSISRQWMEGVRQNGKYILAVWDNGHPIPI